MICVRTLNYLLLQRKLTQSCNFLERTHRWFQTTETILHRLWFHSFSVSVQSAKWLEL